MPTFFEDYMFYASENEALPKLHRWAGLMVLSAALSRRVWLHHGDWQISPNLYCFLVGPPASGKSVAMELAEKVVHDFTSLEVCPDQITREKLTEHMGKKCVRKFIHDGVEHTYTPITIFSDELVILLGTEPMRMIDLLTAIYGNKPAFKVATKHQGNDDLIAPCITLLGCITPSTLDSFMTQKLITGGFNRRMLLIYAPYRGKPNPIPKMLPEHYAAKARCTAYAKKVEELVGPFSWEPAAEEYFREWYITVKDPQMRAATNDVMQRYFAAKDIQAIKVSMLLSVADSLDKKIRLSHIQEALRMLDELEPDIMTILGGGGRNDLAPIICSIERFIKDYPSGVTAKRIKLNFRNQATDKEIADILSHLVETDSIARRPMLVGQFHVDHYFPPTPPTP